MSGYRDFSKCTICRSVSCLKHYRGKYDVTLAINTMYLIIVNYVERKDEIIKNAVTQKEIDVSIVTWLKDRDLIITHDCTDEKAKPNEFDEKKVVKNLRNGLAHLHIKVIGEPNKCIEQVRIWVPPYYECDKKKYKVFDDNSCGITGAMCIFCFTPKELKQFIYHSANTIMDRIPYDCTGCNCETCPQKTNKEV